MTTLAVVRAWGDDPEAGVRLLREAIERARALGLVEEWWRAGANMAVVLELLGRPGEAIDEAFADMAEARAMDLDAVYANLLGGNVAGILVDVGRWPEARDLSLRALDWSPAGSPSSSSTTAMGARARHHSSTRPARARALDHLGGAARRRLRVVTPGADDGQGRHRVDRLGSASSPRPRGIARASDAPARSR